MTELSNKIHNDDGALYECKLIFNLNKKLLKKEGCLYLLDYKCITTGELFKAYFNDGKKYGNNIKELITNRVYPLISTPIHRARQRLLYEQLPHFKSLLPIIDEALENFFLGRYIGCYMMLVPVVEGLLLRWSNSNTKFKPKEFIKQKTLELFNKNKYFWLRHNILLLRYSIRKHFFNNDKSANTEMMYNRHLVSHLKGNITPIIAKKNSTRIFSIIDLIAICMSYEIKFESCEIEVPHGRITTSKYKIEGKEFVRNLVIKYLYLSSIRNKIQNLNFNS